MIPQIWQDFFKQQRKQANDDNLGRRLRLLRHQAAGRVLLGSQELINFSSNDYLGLAGDLRIAEAAARAAGRYGWGAGASRIVTGTSIVHNELENALAKFRGTDAALAFGSGYQANLGVISALAGSGDTVFSDAMNHASIIAACRLSGADVKVYKHLAYDELERQLAASPATGKRLIVSDSLFSIDGDVVDCARLLHLAERFEALLVLDDAHANAVLGKRGRGIAELQNVSARVALVTGSFSKAFGSFGGFVACNRDVREFLINSSRPFIYTTAMPITLAAANIEAIRIVNTEGEALRQKLAGLVRTLRTKLAAAGFEPKGEHQIVPIVIGDEAKAMQFSEVLENQGMLVHPMRFPTVPKGKATLRISLSAAHTDDDVYRLVNAFKAARDKVSGKGTGKVTRREAKRPEETVEVHDDSTMSGLNFDEVKALVAEAMGDAKVEPKVEKITDRLPTDDEPSPQDDPTSKGPEKPPEKATAPVLSAELAPDGEELPDPTIEDPLKKTKTVKRQTRIHKKV